MQPSNNLMTINKQNGESRQFRTILVELSIHTIDIAQVQVVVFELGRTHRSIMTR
jgi:predicted aspartyl protease